MKNLTMHDGFLEIVERLPSSANGNPRHLCEVDGHRFRTKVDSDLGYSIPNHKGKWVRVTIGTHYGVPTLNTLNVTGENML